VVGVTPPALGGVSGECEVTPDGWPLEYTLGRASGRDVEIAVDVTEAALDGDISGVRAPLDAAGKQETVAVGVGLDG